MPPTRRFTWLWLAVLLVSWAVGCGSDPTPTTQEPAGASTATAFDSRPPSSKLPSGVKAPQPTSIPPVKQAAPSRAEPPRTLADLVIPEESSLTALAAPLLPTINDAAVGQLGIRKLSGKHLLLYTDLPANPAVDELPVVFDSAVPQWREYFSTPPEQTEAWRVVGYLIQDKERFDRAGLIPKDLPEFLHGYHRGAELWLYEQPTEYYRRHLLLHEGTHAFMIWSLGGAGPPWYMEGTAELFATHRWENGQLTLRYFPRNKEEVPGWGRIKIVKNDVRAERGKTLMEVLRYDSRAHLQVEPYGWCWAIAAFFENHPDYQQRFRELPKYARDTQESFSERFVGWFREDGARLWREWQWYVVNLEYGYDVVREAFQNRPAEDLPADGCTVEVAANRGWQSTGVRLEAGKKYRIAASGRYQLGTQPAIWWCEPNGVTIRYHRGRPLGMLLGAIVDESDPKATDNGFLSPAAIGTELETTPPRNGTLYLRINDAPAELSDNQGSAQVRITSAVE